MKEKGIELKIEGNKWIVLLLMVLLIICVGVLVMIMIKPISEVKHPIDVMVDRNIKCLQDHWYKEGGCIGVDSHGGESTTTT